MLKIIILFITLIHSVLSYSGNIIFPKNNEKCITVIQECSFNKDLKCNVTFCGKSHLNFILNKYITETNIIGKRFSSNLEAERFIQSNLPKDLSHLYIQSIDKEFLTPDDYSSRRLLIIMNKNSIENIIIG